MLREFLCGYANLCLERQGGVELFHLAGVLGGGLDRGDPGAQPLEQVWLLAQPPQLAREVTRVLQLEEQTVLCVSDELGTSLSGWWQRLAFWRRRPRRSHQGRSRTSGEGTTRTSSSDMTSAKFIAREGTGEGDPAVVSGELAQFLGERRVPLRVAVDGECRVELGRKQHAEGPHEGVAALVRHQVPTKPTRSVGDGRRLSAASARPEVSIP